MPNVQVVVVENVEGKWGPQIKDKEGYLSFGKFYKGEKEFETGTVLEADVYISPKGSRYINAAKVVNTSEETPSVKRGRKPKTEDTLPTTAILRLNDKKVVDWDELGRGKTASLFVAALLQNPNVVQSIEDLNWDKIDGMEKSVWELVDVVFKTRKEKK